MASADPRDPIYGGSYTGTPVQQASRGGTQTVLDMYSMAVVMITTNASDNHYAPNGDLYHE